MEKQRNAVGGARQQGRIVGLCEDMCPEFEMHEREYRGGGDLPIFESVRRLPASAGQDYTRRETD